MQQKRRETKSEGEGESRREESEGEGESRREREIVRGSEGERGTEGERERETKRERKRRTQLKGVGKPNYIHYQKRPVTLSKETYKPESPPSL